MIEGNEQYVSRSLAVADGLITAGVPIFCALPDPTKPIGFALPGEWQRADMVSARRAVRMWKPGMALCAVMGHTLDLIDFDPRSGTPDTQFTAWPTAYATASTPSGGTHAFIASLRVGSRDAVLPGVDIKGGRPDGQGRGFAFIAPTVRVSKVDGSLRAYEWTYEPDCQALPGLVPFDTSGAALAELVAGKLSARSNGNGWNQPSTELAVFRPPARTFTREQAWAYCEPWLRALREAPDGERNYRLNQAAKVFSHFAQPAGFWTDEWAWQALIDAIPPKEHGTRSWDARSTIASAWRSAVRDWRAELVEEATFPDAALHQHIPALPVPAPNGLNLPEEFWSERPELTHIRRAAHACACSADVVLHATLARMAAMWPHGVRLDSGVRKPASANYFAAVLGPSGSGKSSGVSVAADLLPVPPRLRSGGFVDNPLGSGEGLAEAYMGWEMRPVAAVADPETGELVQPMGRDGLPKQERVRTQVRHNALFYADEGESLAKMLERTGATIGETLRRAWTGATIGQANGRSETTRIISKGSYALGLVIGFQLETVQSLIADAHAGTPQRFLWAWALDGAQSTTRVADPGPLGDVWPSGESVEWIIGAADERPMAFVESIRERLWSEQVAHTRGEQVTEQLDEHEPLTLVKVSAMLASLAGRREVNEDDWRLATIVWQTSCRVRDYAIEYGRWVAGKAAAAKRAAYADHESAAETARLAIRSSAESASVERVARRMAIRIHERGPAARRDARSSMAARDRSDFDAALDHAVEMGWIMINDAQLEPGSSRPS